jgi:hypothetical protein
MTTRPSNQFRDKFDLALEAGGEFEDFLHGLIANATIECKRDYEALHTGNLFVEYRCRGKPSGLAVTQAEWWAFGLAANDGDIERILLVSTAWLKATLHDRWGSLVRVRGGDDGLSEGVLLPLWLITTRAK